MCKSCNHGLNDNNLCIIIIKSMAASKRYNRACCCLLVYWKRSILCTMKYPCSDYPSKTWNENIVGLPAQPYMKNVLVFCDIPHALLPNQNLGIGVSFENKFYNSWMLRIASIVNPAKTGDGNFFTLFKPRKIILKRDFCDSDTMVPYK